MEIVSWNSKKMVWQGGRWRDGGRESRQIKLRWAHHVFHHIHIQNWTPVFFFFYHHHFNYGIMSSWAEYLYARPWYKRRWPKCNICVADWRTIRWSLRVPGSTFRSLLELLLPARAESAGSYSVTLSSQLSQETCLTPGCWSLYIN